MIPVTTRQIALAVGGTLLDATGDEVVTSVCSDSRDAIAGSMFVAIAGERVDGHDFAQQVFAAGASAILAARPVGGPAVIVADPVGALGRLAAHALTGLDATVVAVTGSSGKTSTKDLIAQVVEPPVVAPIGSFNTDVGLPLTVLRADENTRVLVLEMGMRGLGHIRTLTQIAPPDISVVTNVGTAHLELLGSQAGIAQAKGEIVEALTADGLAILNADDPYVASMSARTVARVMTYGLTDDTDVQAQSIILDELARPSFVLRHGTEFGWVAMSLHGAHQVPNALAAAAVGFSMGLDMETVTRRLAEAEPRSKWRMEVSKRSDGLVVINDAYNANPESMRAGLAALASMGKGRGTWAVLGEMREIGPTSAAEHAAIGALGQQFGIVQIVAVGEGARPLAEGAKGGPSEVLWLPDPASALDHVGRHVHPGDAVLIKASRSIGLDIIAIGLLEGRSE
jgi:UDP-N-acetylmuramoyl-tripeptide--D-alanyl-D-alanine ligase